MRRREWSGSRCSTGPQPRRKTLRSARTTGAGALPARRFWDVAGNPFMVADPRAGAPNFHGWWRGDQEQAGMFLHGYESLWLPATLLQDAERGRLAGPPVAASHHKEVGLHFNKGLAGAPGEAIAAARGTAAHPRITQGVALAVITGCVAL